MRLLDKWRADCDSYLQFNIKQRVKSVLYGFIVGDCLGVPVEFKQRGAFRVDSMLGYGTYNQPAGTWSDDTSLTLCLVENMIEEGDLSSLMNKFVAYQDNGYLTPYGQMFDIGRTTQQSIEKFKLGMPVEQCGGNQEFDNGNGALMRLSPLLFDLQDDFNFIKKVMTIKAYTEITHAHSRSVVASIFYVQLLISLSLNNPLVRALESIAKLFLTNYGENHPYTKELFSSFGHCLKADFFELPESEIKSTGYVVDSLEAAMWCLGTTNDFSDAVLKAVNLGDDTDTIGAITGSLAGVQYGFEAIPQDWVNQIANKELVDNVINKFIDHLIAKERLKESAKNCN